MISLIINGETRQVADVSTLMELVAHLELEPLRVAIEVNRRIVRRADWPGHTLNDHDKVEIVQFVGGG